MEYHRFWIQCINIENNLFIFLSDNHNTCKSQTISQNTNSYWMDSVVWRKQLEKETIHDYTAITVPPPQNLTEPTRSR